MQKRDSKSFDVVALHRNQLDEEESPPEMKTHQSLDYGLYVEEKQNGNGVNGDSDQTTDQSNGGRDEAASPTPTNEVWYDLYINKLKNYLL